MATEYARPTGRSRFAAALLPVMAVVLAIFLMTGLSVPVVPLHVHHGLGMGEFVVGLVVGSQFAIALVSRPWAGHIADRKGAKFGVIMGLWAAMASGLLYLVSLSLLALPLVSVSILLAGRALLGAAESFLITGAMSLGLGLVEPGNEGRVIAWVGAAMFIALGLGAPIGTTLYDFGGFSSVAWATLLVPLATFAVVARLSSGSALAGVSSGFFTIARKVWMPGLGAALSSVGFGAILAFSSLLFVAHDWSPVWLPFSAYVAGLIVARIFFGHLPDQFGGARIALIFVLIESAGLLLVGLSPSMTMAVGGTFITGFGCALVYPGLGAEALRRAPPQSRGLVMGTYTVFLDTALGFVSPALGLIAGKAGLDAVFLASSVIVLSAAVIVISMLLAPAKSGTNL